MVSPSGYTALDLIGYTDRGNYSVSANYVRNDLVHYNGDIWRVLVDDTTGITPAEGVNYTIFIESPTNATAESIAPIEGVTATKAHAQGTQLYYNDVLYDVIANIAIGDTLTVGTNIQTAKTITEQIADVESALDTQGTTLSSQIAKCEALKIEIASFSSLPQTVSNANIESDMICVHSELGTPSAQVSDWTVSTSNGSLVVSGSISGSTTLTLYLIKSR